MEGLSTYLFWIIAAATAICAIAVVVSQNIVRAATWLLFTLGGTAGIFFLLGADLVGATQILVYVGGTLVLLVFGVMLTAQGPFITMKTGAAEWVISGIAGLLFFGVLAASAFTVGKVGPPKLKTPRGMAEDYAGFERLTESLRNEKHPVASLSRDRKPAAEQVTTPNGTTLWVEYLKGATPEQKQKANSAIRQIFAASSTAVIGQGFLGVGVGPAHADPNRQGKPVRTNYLLPFEIVSVHLLVVLIGAAYLARAKRRRREAA